MRSVIAELRRRAEVVARSFYFDGRSVVIVDALAVEANAAHRRRRQHGSETPGAAPLSRSAEQVPRLPRGEVRAHCAPGQGQAGRF